MKHIVQTTVRHTVSLSKAELLEFLNSSKVLVKSIPEKAEVTITRPTTGVPDSVIFTWAEVSKEIS